MATPTKRRSLKAYEAEHILRAFDRCVYCGIAHLERYRDANVPAVLEVEHIVSVQRGGTNDRSNLTVACRRCNRSKGTRTAEEYGFPKVETAYDRLGDSPPIAPRDRKNALPREGLRSL